MMKKVLLSFAASVCFISAQAQWQQTNGLQSKMIPAIAVSGSAVYAATSDTGLFLSPDNGASWTGINKGLTNTTVNAMLLNGATWYAGTNGGVFLSSDQGSSWTSAGSTLAAKHVLSIATTGSSTYAGTQDNVYVTADNGKTWNAVSAAGLPAAAINALAVMNGDLVAGTDTGVYILKPSASAWTAMNSGLTSKDVKAIGISDNNVYACTYSGGIFVANASQMTWSALNTGLTNTHVWTIVIKGRIIAIGTGGGGTGGGHGGGTGGGHGKGGVFRLSSDGQQWVSVNGGLTKNDVRSLAVSGTDMYAGTADGGVWKMSLDEINSGVDETTAPIGKTSIYPNPTTGDIYLNCPSQLSRVEVHNVLGELVYTEQKTPQQSLENYKLTLGGLQPGIYVLNLFHNGQTETVKVIKK